jgi:nitroreductase
VDAASSASKAGRTIPYSGDNSYINMYLFTDSGAYLYMPDKKNLKEITDKNSRALITPENIDNAYGTILFTIDSAKLPPFLKKNPAGASMAHAGAGFAAQNILLASASLGISGIVMYNIKPKEISDILKLSPDETPLFIVQFGYTK